ncbi:MAG: hypothetical protein HKN32_02890, partial [Flavobacteriales bacterium]|nr:hypothetical protein [Flavobacteriales bacterium]
LMGGITNGRNNSTGTVYDVYGDLGYDIITVSDYMWINRDSVHRSDFIPVYEHGYSLRKTHQVLIGAEEVTWFDYPLFQTRHAKQHIINRLREHNDIIALAHPLLRNGYSIEDMRYLTGYEMIEVMNRYAMSWEHWDAALSAGKPVFMLANDDAHDLAEPMEAGRMVSVLNCSPVNRKNVVEALRHGRLHAFRAQLPWEDPVPVLRQSHKKLPKIMSIQTEGPQVKMSFDEYLYQVILIGQGGDTIRVERFADSIRTKHYHYTFNPEDTYIRAMVEFKDYDKIFLNPIFRTQDGLLPKIPTPTVNMIKTIVYRGIVWILILVFARWRWRLRKLRKARL